MVDDTGTDNNAPARTGGASYLRLLPDAAIHRRVVRVEGATDAAIAPGAPRAPATDLALAELTELAAATPGAALARLSLAANGRSWWAGTQLASVAQGSGGARVLEHLFDSGETTVVEDVRTDPRFSELPRTGIFAWCRAILCVPVPGTAGTAGTVTVFCDAPLERSDAQIAAVERIARIAGALCLNDARRSALARRRGDERRLERALARAQARDQRALSHRLHEEVANHLAGTALLVQSMTNRTPETSGALRTDLTEVRRQLHAVLAESRALACDNFDYLVETHGVAQALSLVIGRLSVSGAVTCTAIADSEALHELSDSVALNLLRIAQVATLRARAARETSRITVRLRRLSCGGARLSITADSQWIAADPHSPPESSWEALRYYARRIGAEVVAREAGPAAHRLEVVRRAVRKGEP